MGSVIVYGLAVGLFASLVGGPLFLKLLGKRVPFKEVPAAFADIQARNEDELPTLGASLHRATAYPADAGQDGG